MRYTCNPGVNKGTALVALAQEMHLSPADFLAIGDSLNDIQMLKTAGIGVTVANAHPETKAVAPMYEQKSMGMGLLKRSKSMNLIFSRRNDQPQYNP